MSKQKRFGKKTKPKTPPKKNPRLAAMQRVRSRKINPVLDLEEEPVVDKSPNPTAVEGRVSRRGDNGLLLTDPHRARSDIKLVEMSIRKGWNVQRKTMLRRRMEDIVAKTEAEVITKDGVVSLESAGDKLSIEAGKVLVAMDGADIKRVETILKMDSAPQPLVPPVVINVQDNSTTNNVTSNSVEPRRLGIIGLAQRLGARAVVIDGESISIDPDVEPAVPVPKG